MSEYSLGSMTLSRVEQTDIEMLRRWRNDPAVLVQMRDQSEVSPEQQQRWFDGLVNNPTRYLVARYQQRPVGIVNFKPIAAGIFEAGLAIGDEAFRGSVLCFIVAVAQLDYAFERLSAKQILAEVRTENCAAIRFNTQLGYRELDAGSEGMISMQLSRTAYYAAREKLKHFIR